MTTHLPEFPDFRLVKLDDYIFFKHYLKLLPPYSDFNFVSLWSYNTQRDLQYCLLNGNLVLLMRDYIDERPFLLYLGSNQPEHTIETLLEYAKTNLQQLQIALIPYLNIKSSVRDLKKKFVIKKDRANFDYILSLSQIAELQGHEFSNKRNKIVKFKKTYPQAVFSVIDLSLKSNQDQILKVFNRWSESRQRRDVKHEYQAIKRLLHDQKHFNLLCYGIYIDDVLEAFTINELLPRAYAITHFTKADPIKIGVFEFLYHEVAKALKAKGSLYLNREQDLGLDGLRTAKLSWRPIKFLKKYTISKRI